MMVGDVWKVLRRRQVPGTLSVPLPQSIGYGAILFAIFGGYSWLVPIGMIFVVSADYYSNTKVNEQLMRTLHLVGIRQVTALYARSVIYIALPLFCLVVSLCFLAPMTFHTDVEPPNQYLFWGAVAGTGMMALMANIFRVYLSRSWRSVPVVSGLLLVVAVVGLVVLAFYVGDRLMVEPTVELAPLVAVAACWTVAMLGLNVVAISLRARQDMV